MYLVFDTETAGLPGDWNAPASNTSNWPRLVQIAWVLLDRNYQQIASGNRIVKPDGFIIPENAARVHGITTEIATLRGLPLKDVLKEFRAAAKRSKVAVAHNIAFDSKVVTAECYRTGTAFPFFMKREVCTMLGSTDYLALPGPYGNKWPTLDELHSCLFDAQVAGAHDAAVDVAACARCFVELRQRKVL